MIRFRSADFDLEVVDNGAERAHPRFHNLAEAMQTGGYVAGSNGGFFELRDFGPNGLMIASSTRVGTFDPRNWAEGVLTVRNRSLALEGRDSFKLEETVSQLVQTGPWLMRHGVVRTHYETDGEATRSFIATDGEGGWVIGHVTPVSLFALAVTLGTPALQKVCPIREALNLDGGPSSGLWMAGKEPVYLPERSIVRNFLGLRPKKREP